MLHPEKVCRECLNVALKVLVRIKVKVSLRTNFLRGGVRPTPERCRYDCRYGEPIRIPNLDIRRWGDMLAPYPTADCGYANTKMFRHILYWHIRRIVHYFFLTEIAYSLSTFKPWGTHSGFSSKNCFIWLSGTPPTLREISTPFL